MKKNILLVGLCIVFSATTSFAQCNQTGGCPLNPDNNCDKVYKPSPIKEKTCNNEFSVCPQNSFDKYKNYINKIQRERAAIYNALDLTDEQIQKQEEIFKQNEGIYEEKLEQLEKEDKKLCTLKKANASNSEISKQKKIVKKIKNDIKNIINKENKAYKKCLTHEQCSKYSMLKKLQKQDYNQINHQKDLYKSNPKMRPFGNPTYNVSCPCENKVNK